jgi:hypothetical protein
MRIPERVAFQPVSALFAPATSATEPSAVDRFDGVANGPLPALPDLIIHTPSALEVGPSGTHVKIINGKPFLKYAFSVGNRGPGHLLILGSRPDTTFDTLAARQLAFQGDDLVVVREKGEFRHEGAAGHNHWHYANTGKVSLTRDDLPEYKVEANKSHFLMINSGRVLDPLPRDPAIPSSISSPLTYEGLSYKIGSTNASELRSGQKILSGTFDRYHPNLNAPLALPEGDIDGTYTLQMQVDQDDNLLETDETNNVVTFQVVIAGGQVTTVTQIPNPTQPSEPTSL